MKAVGQKSQCRPLVMRLALPGSGISGQFIVERPMAGLKVTTPCREYGAYWELPGQ